MDDAPVNKLFTTLNLGAPPKAEIARQTQWEEIRSVFPIYIALAKHLQIEIPFPQNKRVLPEKAEPEFSTQVQTWLDSLDRQVQAHQLRHLLQTTTLIASESGLRALTQRHLRKSTKSNPDRDKIDFLLVQYFALCAPARIYHKQIELTDVAQVMKPILGEVDSAPLNWCEPLEKMIQTLRTFKSLRDMLKTNFIEQGRKVKEGAGGMFYDPSAMLAFVRFNFLLRRTLIELMHADLIYIRSGINHLESAGATTVECQTSGLGPSEPITKIRQITDDWKQPFQKEYSERSVNQAFETLLGLRADVERTIERVIGKPAESISAKGTQETTAVREALNAAPTRKSVDKNAEAGGKSEDGTPVLDFESCMEQVWEQLNFGAAVAWPLHDHREGWGSTIADVLLGGGGVRERRRPGGGRFAACGGCQSDGHIGAGAGKKTGNATGIDHVLPIARMEVSRLQERVEVAKRAKDTEAAVNLGISTKRLLSALDEGGEALIPCCAVRAGVKNSQGADFHCKRRMH